uniref:Uncharacterized protein n=1 Tax=Anguilla anguilla TaxID=7936 RepID=A0A0E9SQF4_ANGAN
MISSTILNIYHLVSRLNCDPLNPFYLLR